VLRHADGTISASSDGANWRDLQPGSDPGYGELLRDRFAVWQDHVVGWWNPKDPWRLGEFANPHPVMAGDIVSVLQPPAARSESTPFTGRIETMGVGPAGIVAQVKAPRDDRPGYGWYSADGTHWTEVQFDRDYADRPQTLPRSFGQVVGVSDGFIARDFDGDQSECPDLQYGCSTMWHSSDGLTWTKLGIVDSVDGSLLLLPWNGGALLTDGISRFDLWTSEGSSELSLADEVPAPAEFFRANVGTGPLGLVTMLYGGDHPEALITRDGVSWKVQPAPSVPASFASMAVGESSVLYLGWTGDVYEGDILVPHLWVGTANP